MTTYHDLPVVKAPPWKWYVPAYFYAGGLAGAAATLAAVTRRRDEARRLHWIAIAAEAVGSGLLVADLGKPSRAHHMLRVFRPTSPMNMGSWILGTAGTTSLATLLGSRVANRFGALPGSMLTAYTGVLIGNTAIPIWSSTRTIVPPWFSACAAQSLASLLELVDRRPPRAYAIAAKVAQLGLGVAVETVAASQAAGDRVVAPLREGRSGAMWKASRWLAVGSLAATLVKRRRVAGVLGTVSAVLARFAIVEAGKASAADPRATFEPQRAQMTAGG